MFSISINACKKSKNKKKIMEIINSSLIRSIMEEIFA